MAELNPDLLPIELEPATTSFQGISGKTYRLEYQARLSVDRARWLE